MFKTLQKCQGQKYQRKPEEFFQLRKETKRQLNIVDDTGLGEGSIEMSLAQLTKFEHGLWIRY